MQRSAQAYPFDFLHVTRCPWPGTVRFVPLRIPWNELSCVRVAPNYDRNDISLYQIDGTATIAVQRQSALAKSCVAIGLHLPSSCRREELCFRLFESGWGHGGANRSGGHGCRRMGVGCPTGANLMGYLKVMLVGDSRGQNLWAPPPTFIVR